MVNGKKEADVHAHRLYIADYNYRLEGECSRVNRLK